MACIDDAHEGNPINLLKTWKTEDKRVSTGSPFNIGPSPQLHAAIRILYKQDNKQVFLIYSIGDRPVRQDKELQC